MKKWFSKKLEISKAVQIMSYLISIEKEFRDRGRWIHWTSTKLNFALFLMDMEHRAKHGDFLFSTDYKRLGLHGIYYKSVTDMIGSSPNQPINEHVTNGILIYQYGLSDEERFKIEAFLEKNYSHLERCHYSKKELESSVPFSVDGKYLSNAWMEALYQQVMDSTACT